VVSATGSSSCCSLWTQNRAAESDVDQKQPRAVVADADETVQVRGVTADQVDWPQMSHSPIASFA
jgi:hypothetical protein